MFSLTGKLNRYIVNVIGVITSEHLHLQTVKETIRFLSTKMPTTSARSRTGSSDSRSGQTKSPCPLSMECEDDELTPEQISFYNK